MISLLSRMWTRVSQRRAPIVAPDSIPSEGADPFAMFRANVARIYPYAARATVDDVSAAQLIVGMHPDEIERRLKPIVDAREAAIH